MDARVRKLRAIREAILRLLYNTFVSCPDVGVMARHVYEGFTTGRVQYMQAEIDAVLADLIEDKLITVENVPGVEAIPDKMYRVTSRGRDFVLARFPWDCIDEFTGKESLT